jgi:branched-chain amino acid aminotransferase
MSGYFIYNGKMCKPGTLVAGPLSRALRFGDGLFETMKWANGELLHADEHFARLWRGLVTLRFDCPRSFNPDTLQQQMIQVIDKNGHRSGARVRLCVFRGEGGLYDPKNLLPNYTIESIPLPESHAMLNSNGLVLGIYRGAFKACDSLANLKHNNYLPYVLAALEAKTQHWNDAILLNMYGRICDTTVANLFMVKDGTVFTPALEEGCVAGIMRRHLLSLLRQAGIPAVEQALSTSMLLEADEVFLTNAIYGLRWVQSVEDVVYGNMLTPKIYQLLHPTI